MRPLSRSFVLAALPLIFTCQAVAQENGEKRLWKDTGTTQHGRLEPQQGPAVPEKELREIDFESLRKVEGRWEKLLNKTHRVIPPLKYTVPVDAKRRPSHPPTALGGLEKAPGDFIFIRNTSPSTVAMPSFSSQVNEPSVASSRTHVVYTGNWYAATSQDKGGSFSLLNPFSGPFPDPASGSFCCDQVTAYDPGTNTLFMMQQYLSNTTTGVQRINVDQEGDGTFDCFYDVSPQIMGFAANNFSDFPDLAVSDDWLYHSTNVFSTVGLGFSGAFVARYSLAHLSACSSVSFDSYTDPSFFSFKLTRGASSRMYFADHISTASIRIWRWPDGVSAPTSFDRAVRSWTEATRTCPGPDGRDSCGFIDRRMAGAYIASGTVGFMWVPAQDGTFPQPYTRVAQFSELSLTLTGEPIIWSGSIAWTYPSVAVNESGDLGGTIMAGGASLHPCCVAWIADDVNGDNIAPLENQVALSGSSGPPINRSGDYNSAATNYPNESLWVGACFAYPTPTTTESRFVLFGREGDHAIFTDGFESGNTSAW